MNFDAASAFPIALLSDRFAVRFPDGFRFAILCVSILFDPIDDIKREYASIL